ncbi:MAG TPA: DUF177 domain-containing protein [Gemmatimonadota bacterium]|nr:DUF177 domain-containing protein [Gemmatimonadota bacterium]
MLRLDLNRLREGRLEERFEIAPGSPVLEGYEPEVRAPLGLEVLLHHPSGRTYVLEARLRGTVHVPCTRCLTPAAVDLDEPFRVVYQERSARDAVREEETGDDDVVWIESGATEIDVAQQVRDRLFVETDWFPLCRQDCAGICPVCGANRNEEDCGCVVETASTHWKALKELDLRGEERG